MSIEKTLEERGKTHGDFSVNAEIAQDMKMYFREQKNWSSLPATQRDALDMFAAKVARILSGGNNNKDNWHDIAGYATLAEMEIK